MKTTPHQHRYWLKEHQITAFWHEFGISNGLSVPKKHISNNQSYYQISAEYMQSLLVGYVKWLNTYKEVWDIDEEHEVHPKNKKQFLIGEKKHTSRAKILEMIELLQECRIDDK